MSHLLGAGLTDSPVVAAVQESPEEESRYWMLYLEMGLPLSAPRLHCSATLLSVLSITRRPPGAPGGPGRQEATRDRERERESK